MGAIAATLVIAVGAVVAGRDSGRIALPVDAIEYAARPSAPAMNAPRNQTPRAVPRVALDEAAANDAAPLLAQPDLAPETSAGADPTGWLDDDSAANTANTDRVVITIAGAEPVRAHAATPASLNPGAGLSPIAEPDASLLHQSAFGAVPRIGPTGRKPLDAYARRHERQGRTPQLALVVAGLGLNPDLTRRAIEELPAEFSLAFAPYAEDLEYWTDLARRDGHEVVLELPMEGYGDSETTVGAAGLLSSRSAPENLQRLDWLLSRTKGYFAATNYRGAKLSSDAKAMTPVLARLKEAGVAYIDDTGAVEGQTAAAGLRVLTAEKVIASGAAGSGAIRRDLRSLEEAAKASGGAIGKAYASDIVLDEVTAWIDVAPREEIEIAPASSLLRRGAVAR